MFIGGIDYSKIINPECGIFSKVPIKTINVNIKLNVQQTPFLKVHFGPDQISYSEFVKEGYSKIKNNPSEIPNSTIEAKDIIVTPHSDDVNKFFIVKLKKFTLLNVCVFVQCIYFFLGKYMAIN